MGHALFDSPDGALDDPFVRRLAEDSCAIAIATEHFGLAADQRATALAAMTELSQLPVVTETFAQSLIDLIALAALVRGPLARELPIDPANLTYIGAALGGLAGATFLAYEQGDLRAALSPASWPPPELVDAMAAAYPADAHLVTTSIVLGMGFEPYAPLVTAGDVGRELLVWSAMGERAAESIAREMAMPVLAPSVLSPWGLALASEPTPRGLVLFDNAPAASPALARQVAQVIANRPLTMQCQLGGAPAPCDCATGACD